MSFTNDIKTTACPSCKTGKVMTGRHQEFNAKSADGKIICNSCKVDEIVARWKKDGHR